MTALPLLCAALATSSGELLLDGAVRDELRFGTALALGGGASPVGAADALLFNAGLNFSDNGHSLTLRYDPQLLIPDLGEGNDLQGINEGLLAYSWSSHSGKFRLLLSEDAAYGIIDIFALTPSATTAAASTSTTSTSPSGTSPQAPGTATVQAIPTATGLKYESSSSVGDLTVRPTERLSFELGGGYLLNGGVNQPPRLERPYVPPRLGDGITAELPLERGPFGNLTESYQLTHLDTLSTRLAVTDLRFSNGPLDLLVELTEQETHHIDRQLSLAVAAGYAETRFQPAPAMPGQLAGRPEAAVTIADQQGLPEHHTLTVTGTASLGPLIDRLSGTIYESTQLLGRLEWTAPRGFGLRLLGGINQPLYGILSFAEDVQILQGALFYQPLPFLRFEAGAVGTWEEPTLVGGLSTQWLAYGAVGLQESVRK